MKNIKYQLKREWIQKLWNPFLPTLLIDFDLLLFLEDDVLNDGYGLLRLCELIVFIDFLSFLSSSFLELSIDFYVFLFLGLIF